MDEDYELRSIFFGEELLCYELARADSSISELERWQEDPKKRRVIAALYKMVKKIKEHGVPASRRTFKLRLLSAKENLYEIKNYLGVNREMSCIVLEDETHKPVIVLLFGFEGHQGADGKIPEEKMDKASRLSGIALRLLKMEGIIK